MIRFAVVVAVCLIGLVAALEAAEAPANEAVAALAQEVAAKGWIVYSARSDNGTWDLYLSRPDGSAVRNITNTPDYEEAAARFAPNSTRILYRRLAKGTQINHDQWGFQGELVISKPDGSTAVVVGGEGEYPWASWSEDGKQLVCLEKKGIKVVDLGTRQVVKELPRQGIYQQLFCSPDGKWFCGTANYQNAAWTVVRMSREDGALNVVHVFQNCTPDWFPDSEHIVYSSRPGDQKTNNGYGWTQLWMSNGDGTGAQLIYGEEGFHIYGGEISPDNQYVMFTKCPNDGGGVESKGALMCVMRMADAPSIGGESPELHSKHANTKNGPVLELTLGWEPHWTYENVGAAE